MISETGTEMTAGSILTRTIPMKETLMKTIIDENDSQEEDNDGHEDGDEDDDDDDKDEDDDDDD